MLKFKTVRSILRYLQLSCKERIYKSLYFFLLTLPAFSFPSGTIIIRVKNKTHRHKYFMSVALGVCNGSPSGEECYSVQPNLFYTFVMGNPHVPFTSSHFFIICHAKTETQNCEIVHVF